MITLIILSYNEEVHIATTIKNYIYDFERIIVVNDGSLDNTSRIISSLKFKNLEIINHNKNMGAGVSFSSGMKRSIELGAKYMIKIDGDNQFKKEDVLKIKSILEKEHYDYIKCDRFWSGGISGKIPTIRYFGNALASFLIKFCSGNWSLNDPLNGLIALSSKAAQQIEFPKKFYKYGYPFFIANKLSQLSNIQKFNIGQFKNVVTYGNEKSYLKPLNMFVKLVSYTLSNYFSKIKDKIKYSDYQFSAILDIFALLFISLSFYSLVKFFRIRYFFVDGPQSSWFLLFIIFFLICVILLTISQRLENRFSKLYSRDID